MIPSDIDCLIPVERRTLVILNRFGSSKPIKSFKIDGCVTGELHPHGSAYGTLVNLVRNGFASSEDSSWGGYGLVDSPPTASRYSETRIEPWVSKFAFEFINYVPWEMLELDSEPLYLPSILPLGLIGDGVINGISFYKTLIPRYRKEDLARRLKFLIENGQPPKPRSFDSKMDEKKYGPKIEPCKKNCVLVEKDKNAFYRLLMLGEGAIDYCPNITTRTETVFRGKKTQKVNYVSIEGRAPNGTFEPLLKAYEKGTLPITNAPIDQSSKLDIKVYLEPKRGIDIDEFIDKISDKFLNKTIHFKCYTCNLDGVVHQTSIDELLLNCFHHWKKAYRKKIVGDVLKVNEAVLEYFICSFIRDKFSEKLNSIEDILKLWDSKTAVDFYEVEEETNKIITKKYVITEEDIKKIYYGSSIRKLVEFKKTLTDCQKRIEVLQKELNEIDENSVKRIIDICGD